MVIRIDHLIDRAKFSLLKGLAMVMPKSQPTTACGYLSCPNKANCSMAAKNKSWIWDYGPKSKSDKAMCYECHYLFCRSRSAAVEAGARPKSKADGGNRRPPKSPKSPGAKFPDKATVTSPTIDMAALVEQLQALCQRQEAGLELDLSPLKSIVEPIPGPPTLTTAQTIAAKLKQLESQKLAKQKRVAALQQQLATLGKELDTLDADIADQNAKYNSILSSLRTATDDNGIDNDEEMTGSFHHVGDDVHISLESLDQWSPAQLATYQAKLEAANLAVQIAIDSKIASSMPAIKEEVIHDTVDASIIVEPDFGPAAAASARSGPYTSGYSTPAEHNSFPDAASVSDQAAFTLQRYGVDGVATATVDGPQQCG